MCLGVIFFLYLLLGVSWAWIRVFIILKFGKMWWKLHIFFHIFPLLGLLIQMSDHSIWSQRPLMFSNLLMFSFSIPHLMLIPSNVLITLGVIFFFFYYVSSICAWYLSFISSLCSSFFYLLELIEYIYNTCFILPICQFYHLCHSCVWFLDYFYYCLWLYFPASLRAS